jgi:hypothetical protein
MATTGNLFRVDSRNAGETVDLRDDASLKASASSENFRYVPLSDNSKTVRLCEILPDLEHGQLVLNLKDCSLERGADHFAALSYCCGPSSPRMPIRLNGLQHHVGQNLHTQMRRLRQQGCHDTIWIDALSIDQTNAEEKTAQISLMDKIYGGAREVYIGLDEGVTCLDEAADEHAFIATILRGLAVGVHIRDLGSLLQGEEAADWHERLTRSMCRFLKSAWFTRVWVIQEVCLAKKATIPLCSGYLGWEVFSVAVRSWRKHRESSCCSPFVGRLDRKLSKAFHQVRWR